MPGRWGTSQWMRTPMVSILAVYYNDEILTPARPQHYTAGGKPRNRNPLRIAGSASPYNPCNRGIITRRWRREAVRVRSSALRSWLTPVGDAENAKPSILCRGLFTPRLRNCAKTSGSKYQATSFMVGVKYEEFHLCYLHLSSGRIRGWEVTHYHVS